MAVDLARQRHAEVRTIAWLSPRLEPSAVQPHVLKGDGQPQPRAAGRPGTRWIGSPEPVEHQGAPGADRDTDGPRNEQAPAYGVRSHGEQGEQVGEVVVGEAEAELVPAVVHVEKPGQGDARHRHPQGRGRRRLGGVEDEVREDLGDELGVDLGGHLAYYWFTLASLVVLGLVLWWLLRSPWGRAFAALRDNPIRAESLGVNTKELLVLHPETGEAAVDVTEMLVRADTDLVVWDSVAATLPLEEQSKSELKDKHQPARLAALMSRATRKITACNRRTALLCVNQTRTSVGIVFGNPETTPGGKALPFYASHRISMRKSGKVTEAVKVTHGADTKQTTKTTAYTIRATIEKSKLTKPFQDVYFRFDLNTGTVDDVQFLVDTAIDRGVITNTKGHTWEFEGHTAKGKGAIPAMIREHDLAETLQQAIFDSRRGATRVDSSKVG